MFFDSFPPLCILVYFRERSGVQSVCSPGPEPCRLLRTGVMTPLTVAALRKARPTQSGRAGAGCACGQAWRGQGHSPGPAPGPDGHPRFTGRGPKGCPKSGIRAPSPGQHRPGLRFPPGPLLPTACCAHASPSSRGPGPVRALCQGLLQP